MLKFNDLCPIWGTAASQMKFYGDGQKIFSPRAGGQYFISGTALSILTKEELDDDARKSLTSWLVKQRNLGIKTPKIYSDMLRQRTCFFTSDITNRCNNLLKYLSFKAGTLGQEITFHPGTDNQISHELLAWTDSLTEIELEAIFDYCLDKGWIDIREYKIGDAVISFYISICIPGFIQLDDIRVLHPTQSTTAFVAMWRDKNLEPVYHEGIAPAIQEAGFEPVTNTQIPHNDRMDDKIIGTIRRSRFVVADFSHGAGDAQGSVYYEAGFAQGLGIPVIFTCKKSDIDNVHFNTRQYNHIIWEETEDLAEQLTNRISAMIGDPTPSMR